MKVSDVKIIMQTEIKVVASKSGVLLQSEKLLTTLAAGDHYMT
jgi:hypothetical protein